MPQGAVTLANGDQISLNVKCILVSAPVGLKRVSFFDLYVLRSLSGWRCIEISPGSATTLFPLAAGCGYLS